MPGLIAFNLARLRKHRLEWLESHYAAHRTAEAGHLLLLFHCYGKVGLAELFLHLGKGFCPVLRFYLRLGLGELTALNLIPRIIDSQEVRLSVLLVLEGKAKVHKSA